MDLGLGAGVMLMVDRAAASSSSKGAELTFHGEQAQGSRAFGSSEF